MKLSSLWREIGAWKLVSLGKGIYEFQFSSIEDMRKIWAIGTFNLKPGVLRLIKWSADFCPYTQKQTRAHVWIRLMGLPQEYTNLGQNIMGDALKTPETQIQKDTRKVFIVDGRNDLEEASMQTYELTYFSGASIKLCCFYCKS